MQTIVIVLDSNKMNNPDLDIRYVLPDRIEEYTEGRVKDNGYDYLSKSEMGIWLETENANGGFREVIELLKTESILDNDLSQVAEIYVSEEECAELENCKKVYP